MPAKGVPTGEAWVHEVKFDQAALAQFWQAAMGGLHCSAHRCASQIHDP